MKAYKEEVLKTLGVYELRELARSLGVTSPTTKKRKQLEQEILKISKGEIMPDIKKTNKGRPPKSIKKVENILDVFVPKELLEITLNKKVDNQIGEFLKFSSNSENDLEKYDVFGYVKKTISGYYYFKINGDIEECVSIPNNMIEKYSIVEGDQIKGKAKKLSTDHYYVMELIEQINGSVPVSPRTLGDIEQIVLRDLPISELAGVNEGNNILFINENLKVGGTKIKELISPLQDSYKIVLYAPNITVYTKLLIEKELKGDLLYSLIEDHPAVAYESAINACNYVNVLLQEGKKVLFVIFDIFGLLNGIETFFTIENQKQSEQERIEAVRIVKKIFSMGKVLESGASVTVLASCLMQETEEQLYKNDLVKIADKVLKI